MLRWLHGEFRQKLKKNKCEFFTNSSKKNRRGENNSERIHSEASTTLILRAVKDITRKENIKLIYLMNMDTKILKKILANRTHQHIKRIIYHNQALFIPEM